MKELNNYVSMITRKGLLRQAFKVFFPKYAKATCMNAKPGWEKLPPMPKEGSTFLNDCAI